MTPIVIPSIYKAIDQVTGPMRKIVSANHQFAESALAANTRVQRTFNKVGDSIDGVFSKVVNLGSIIGTTLAIGAGKKIFDMAADTAAFADELSTTSQRLGITTQAFQELDYASKLQNIDTETLTNSLEKLNKNLGDLHKNQGTLESSLKKSNPALAKQLKHAKDTNEAFNIISAAIIKLPNQMDRASLAQAAFGKSGQAMLNLIQAGPDNIRKMREEAHKLGIVLSDETIAAASKFDDAHDAMQTAMKGTLYTIGGQLMPVIQNYMVGLTEWIAGHRELIKEKVELFVNGISNAVQFLSEHYTTIKTGLTWFIGGLITLKAVSVAATVWTYAISAATLVYQTYLFLTNSALRTATIAQWAMNAAMLANPVTWIAIAILALIGILVWVALKTEGWGKQWDATMKWMKAVFMIFKLSLQLYFQAITLYFWAMVNAVVLAWKWAQNKLGLLSDEQFAKDKARIAEEQRMRVEAIRKTAGEIQKSWNEVKQGPGWHVKWKGEEEPSPVAQVNPKQQQQQMMQQAIKGSFTSKNTAEITIKDQTGKAQVTKNPGNIPIKMDTNALGFFGD